MLSAHNNYVPKRVSVGIIGDTVAAVLEDGSGIMDCEIYIDGRDRILMPGLFNGHCHGDMAFAKGLGDDMTLLEQNKKFASTNWFYSLIDNEDRYYSRQLTYCEALLSGTTFIAENMYWGLGKASVKAMSEIGIKGALVEDIRKDFSEPNLLISDDLIKEFIFHCEQAGIIPLLGLVSEEDFEDTLLGRIKKKVDRFDLIHTCHLAENLWRLDIIKEKYKKTSVDYLYHQDFLNSKLIGSHVVHVSEKEISYLAKKNVKVVNTPLCEMKICDGIAPIPDMVKAGITVCLGTDGALWNNSNDIFREMKGMSLLHTIHSGIRSLKKEDILNMATINGAKAFGVEKDYGTIEVGKKASLILIESNTSKMCPIRLGALENITSHVIYNATGSDVTDVIVDGKYLVKNKKLIKTDINRIMKKVENTSEKIMIDLNKKFI